MYVNDCGLTPLLKSRKFSLSRIQPPLELIWIIWEDVLIFLIFFELMESVCVCTDSFSPEDEEVSSRLDGYWFSVWEYYGFEQVIIWEKCILYIITSSCRRRVCWGIFWNILHIILQVIQTFMNFCLPFFHVRFGLNSSL